MIFPEKVVEVSSNLTGDQIENDDDDSGRADDVSHCVNGGDGDSLGLQIKSASAQTQSVHPIVGGDGTEKQRHKTTAVVAALAVRRKQNTVFGDKREVVKE